MKKKTVAIIGTNGLPARYGGFETLVNYLVLNLSSEFELITYCSKTPKEKQLKSFNGSELKYIPLSANGMQSIFYDIISIIHAWFKYDVLLILGSSGGVILPFSKLFGKRIVFNFGGLDWQRAKWNFIAKKFLKISESIAVRFSDVIVVDNEVFLDYVKKEYNKDSVLIEYGGDHVIKEPRKGVLEKYGLKYREFFLSVSRAQEDNNIHVLLEAFTELKEQKLAVISNWHISNYGKELKQKYGNFENITLIDAIYDQAELDSIRSSPYCYIHTHSACGTAPSLVEAMNLELPIVALDVPANRATTENNAIYFSNENNLRDIIRNLKSEELERMREESKRIAKVRYNWSVISNKYKELL